MEFHNLKTVIPKLERLLKTNPNRSLSFVFRTLRKDERISNIAEYPLMGFILAYGHSRAQKYQWSISQLGYAQRQIKELRGMRTPEEWKQYLKD